MSLPDKIIVTDVEALQQAIKFQAWYDAMPEGLETGDHFHENVNDCISELLPDYSDLFDHDGVNSIGLRSFEGGISVEVSLDDGTTKDIPFSIA